MWTSADRVLVVGPHIDDVELGCGATIARMRREGVQVSALVLSGAEESMPAHLGPDVGRHECVAALGVLGVDLVSVERYPVRRFDEHRQAILETLVQLRRDLHPTIVIGPASDDVHQDHQVVARELYRAFLGHASVLGFDLPWNSESPGPTMVVRLDENDLDMKLRALAEYRSQAHLNRPYFNEDMIRGLARVRATKHGFGLAERFELRALRIP